MEHIKEFIKDVIQYILGVFDLVYVSPLLSLIIMVLLAGTLGYALKEKSDGGIGSLVGILLGVLITAFILTEVDKELARSDDQFDSTKREKFNNADIASNNSGSNISLGNNENTELSIDAPPPYKDQISDKMSLGFLLNEADKSSIKTTQKSKLSANFDEHRISTYMADDCFKKNMITYLSRDDSNELPDSNWNSLFTLEQDKTLDREKREVLTRSVTYLLIEYYSYFEEAINRSATQCHLN